MKSRDCKAPAKINLALHVLGRRLDGYHELAMAMQRVSLYDEIAVSVGDGRGIEVSCGGVELLPGEDNIACRAAKAFLSAVNIERRVAIDIVKKIPVAAGLGGGSSDAAVVLMALNDLLEVGFSGRDLMGLGASLGADVPFFIFEQAAWATGIGTCLEPLPELPAVSYVLVNPGVAVSTRDVYQSLQLTKGGLLASIPTFSPPTVSALCCGLHNDLERIVLPRWPVVAEVKQRLLAAGVLGALMSGSGSTVFGVCSDRAHADGVAERIREESNWFVQAVNPV